MDWPWFFEILIKSVVITLVLLGGFAYLTWMERRVLALMQVRIGPNRAGWQGLLQPIADAVKLIFKEELIPAQAERLLFIIAPILTVVPAVVITATIPWGPSIPASVFGWEIPLYVADISIGLLYITSIASIAVYGIVLAGWSSNNKYAMMGGIRSTAQMVSYELALGLSFVTVTLMAGSMRTMDIVAAQTDMWFFLIQPVGGLIFLVATLAELNRAPFDMPEAEQELTAGYHTEYSGMKFALFFMAEYTKMIAISAIAATIYFGGYREFWFLKDSWFSVDQNWWLGPIYLFLKIVVLLFFMIWIRATLPRIRYDRLMSFGWKIMLPLSLCVVFITAIGIVLGLSYGVGMQTLFTALLSILVGFGFTLAVDRSLRRKAHA